MIDEDVHVLTGDSRTVRETIDLFSMPAVGYWMRSFVIRLFVWLTVTLLACGSIFAFSGGLSVRNIGVGLAMVAGVFTFLPLISYPLASAVLRIIDPHRRFLFVEVEDNKFLVRLGCVRLIHATISEISYSTGKPKPWSRRIPGLLNNDVSFWRKWRSGLTIWLDSQPPLAVPCGLTPEARASWVAFLEKNGIPVRTKEPFLVICATRNKTTERGSSVQND